MSDSPEVMVEYYESLKRDEEVKGRLTDEDHIMWRKFIADNKELNNIHCSVSVSAISDLWDEVERLTTELTEKDAAIKSLEKRLNNFRSDRNEHQRRATNLSGENRRLRTELEQARKSLEQAKASHKNLKEMRRWDDYDKLKRKYLSKCYENDQLKLALGEGDKG